MVTALPRRSRSSGGSRPETSSREVARAQQLAVGLVEGGRHLRRVEVRRRRPVGAREQIGLRLVDVGEAQREGDDAADHGHEDHQHADALAPEDVEDLLSSHQWPPWCASSVSVVRRRSRMRIRSGRGERPGHPPRSAVEERVVGAERLEHERRHAVVAGHHLAAELERRGAPGAAAGDRGGEAGVARGRDRRGAVAAVRVGEGAHGSARDLLERGLAVAHLAQAGGVVERRQVRVGDGVGADLDARRGQRAQLVARSSSAPRRAATATGSAARSAPRRRRRSRGCRYPRRIGSSTEWLSSIPSSKVSAARPAGSPPAPSSSARAATVTNVKPAPRAARRGRASAPAASSGRADRARDRGRGPR